jgi:hypothetical protein
MLQSMCIIFSLVTSSVIWGKFGPLELTLVQHNERELNCYISYLVKHFEMASLIMVLGQYILILWETKSLLN